MTEDSTTIENLMSQLHAGTTEERFDALLGLAVESSSSLDSHLKEQMRSCLLPLVTGQTRTDQQSGCLAAIALSRIGDHSQDVAWPLVVTLRCYAEDPEKFAGPIDEFMSSSNLLCFVVQVAYALSLFKGDGETVRFLLDIISRCTASKHIKSFNGGIPVFHDTRIQNLIEACLRSIGAIGESENEDGRKMLEWWSSRGSATARAALDSFGHPWEEILGKESELKKVQINDSGSDTDEGSEKDEDDTKGGETLEKLSRILDLCQTNPDAALGFIEMRKMESPGVDEHPILRWVKAMALGGKGLFQPLREMNLSDEELTEVSSWCAEDFRNRLGLTDDHLDYLEASLRQVKAIEAIEPGFVAMIGTDEERVGEAQVDLISTTLERCRPGRVQELMGTTKLLYFGAERRRMGVGPWLDWTPDESKFMWSTRFSAPSVARAAITMDEGADGRGRRFVTCLLYQKCFDEWGPDETLKNAPSAGALYFFDDGSWHHSNDIQLAFIGAVMRGRSLPREFSKRDKLDAEVPGVAQLDSASEVAKEQEPIPE